jgi:hypothetical protein
MRNLLVWSVALALGLLASACQSTHEKGVTSNLRTQWTDVSADTKTTTDAARDVLKDEGLQDVNATSTNVDGKATAKKADGTEVDVTVTKTGEKKSQVSVTVGTIGEPKLGADIARKIKDKAEGNPTNG